MKFITLLAALLFALAVNAQTKSKPIVSEAQKADTIFARFSMCGTIRGDTVMFDDHSRGEALTRYFNRNFRCGDSLVKGFYKFFFIIDKEGRVTNIWYDAGTPEVINKEITRVIGRAGKLIPGSVKGRVAVTVVEARIVFVEDDKEVEKWNYYETDLIVKCYSIR